MTELLMPLLLLLFLAEVIASGRWYAPYFTVGPVIYRHTVQTPGLSAGVSAEELSEVFRGGWGPSLEFHELGPDEFAFRERLFELKLMSYTPVMHGLLRRDGMQNSVVVEGRPNWSTVAFVVGVVWFVASGTDTWFAVIFVAALLGGIYSIQASLYSRVARHFAA